MCVFLIQSSNKRLPFQNGVSAIIDGRCLISDQFVDDAHQNHRFLISPKSPKGERGLYIQP